MKGRKSRRYRSKQGGIALDAYTAGRMELILVSLDLAGHEVSDWPASADGFSALLHGWYP